MTDPNPAPSDKNGKDEAPPSENLFKLMDGVIAQLNITKKMFILMILTVMVLPPIALIISFAIIEPAFEGGQFPGFVPHRDPVAFFIVRNLPLLISLVWLGIGVRQWFILSKWAKRYQRYKERLRQIDKKLDDAADSG